MCLTKCMTYGENKVITFNGGLELSELSTALFFIFFVLFVQTNSLALSHIIRGSRLSRMNVVTAAHRIYSPTTLLMPRQCRVLF